MMGDSISDTGILRKRKSEFCQQESNQSPLDYLFGITTLSFILNSNIFNKL